MPEAEAYLDKVCACIRDKRTRESVRAELRDHLDARAAEYLADGLDEEEAYRKAVSEMGGANAVGEQLGRIHSFFPLRRFNTALTLLFWGFLAVSFQIEFWYIDDIVRTVGSFLMLASAFMLRRSQPLLTAAFALYTIVCVLTIVGTTLAVLPEFAMSAEVALALAIVGSVLSLANMFATSYGVASFSAGKRARQMRRCGFLYTGNYLCFLMMNVLPDLFVLWMIIFVLLLLVILHHIWCVRTDIWRNEREVSVRKMTRTACAAFCLIMVMTVAAPTVTAVALTAREGEVKNYTPVDVGADAATLARVEALVERIKQETGYYKIEGGDYAKDRFKSVFASALADVRQSDLLGFEDAQSFSTFGFSGDGSMTCLVIAAVTAEDRAKILFYYSLYDTLPQRGARQIAFSFGSSWVYAVPDTREVISLCDRGGATVEIVPVYARQSVNFDTDGVELRLSPDMSDHRGYVLQDVYYGGDMIRVTCGIEVYDQKTVFRAPYNYDNLENYGEADHDSDVWYKRNTEVAVYVGNPNNNEVQ